MLFALIFSFVVDGRTERAVIDYNLTRADCAAMLAHHNTLDRNGLFTCEVQK